MSDEQEVAATSDKNFRSAYYKSLGFRKSEKSVSHLELLLKAEVFGKQGRLLAPSRIVLAKLKRELYEGLLLDSVCYCPVSWTFGSVICDLFFNGRCEEVERILPEAHSHSLLQAYGVEDCPE